jgi:uncharacterized protein
MLDLYVDIDACPVFRQVVQAAKSHGLDLYVVTRGFVAVAADLGVSLVLAEDDAAAGNHWIAANIGTGDICVTAEIALAARCVMQGARVLAPSGITWSTDAFAQALRPDASGNGLAWSGRSEVAVAHPPHFARQLEVIIAELRTGIQNVPPKRRVVTQVQTQRRSRNRIRTLYPPEQLPLRGTSRLG